MKTLLFLAALTASSTLAAELPLSGAYGTSEACKLYAERGTEAIIYDDRTADIPADAELLLLRPADYYTHEARCEPLGNSLGDVTFSCEGTDQEWTFNASLSLNSSGDTLTWSVEGESIELHPCPTSETPTM